MSVPLLTSPVIPPDFRHGFTTRAGGVSQGAFASLNLGFKWGDDPTCVRENRRRVHEASGAEALFLAHQVHGAAVALLNAESTPQSIASVQADALVVQHPGWSVAVIVADCVPILLADPTSGACAAVHAGWRGTTANVVGAAVRAMAQAAGANPTQIRAAIGPSIGPCCFEVGPEVVDAFRKSVPGPPSWLAEGSRPHVDLWDANLRLLLGAGLLPQNIHHAGSCTHCDADRFYSYRREGTATGQLMAFIGVNR